MSWLEWAGIVALVILAINGAVITWLVGWHAFWSWRRAREVRQLERMWYGPREHWSDHEGRHIHVTAEHGRIDWPLDLPLARNGDDITVDEEEADGPGSDS